jgi:hypothetical protein
VPSRVQGEALHATISCQSQQMQAGLCVHAAPPVRLSCCHLYKRTSSHVAAGLQKSKSTRRKKDVETKAEVLPKLTEYEKGDMVNQAVEALQDALQQVGLVEAVASCRLAYRLEWQQHSPYPPLGFGSSLGLVHSMCRATAACTCTCTVCRLLLLAVGTWTCTGAVLS